MNNKYYIIAIAMMMFGFTESSANNVCEQHSVESFEDCASGHKHSETSGYHYHYHTNGIYHMHYFEWNHLHFHEESIHPWIKNNRARRPVASGIN